MKKTILIIGAIATILVVYLVVQNNQLKKDVNQSHAKAEELNEYISASDKQSMHFEANDSAEKFIRSYFDFEDHPKEDDVANLVTDQAKEKLDFGDVSQSGEDDQVVSEVKELHIYYGDATDNRQELFATFTNVLTYNEVTSEKASYIKLDMMKVNDQWKVDDFEFRQ